jgi:endonuclease-8
VLEGDVITAEAPHPRAAVLGVAERIDGRRLECVEAVGKNQLNTFEGGVVLRTHLRMRGRWHVHRRGDRILGTPWLVLRGERWEAVQRNGPVLELSARAVARLGPDIMADPPDFEAMLTRLRATNQARAIGEALLDQRLVAGIGNLWRAEALFHASVSPWTPLRDLADDAVIDILRAAAELMRASRGRRYAYRRAGLPCRRCGTPIASRPQGEHARVAYWCKRCQRGTGAAEA